jgi:hypothetical protein
VKALVAVAVLAVAAVAGLLLYQYGVAPPEARRPAVPAAPEHREPPEVVAAPLPGIEARLRGRARTPEVQDELDQFVTLCVARGTEVVPDLLARLRDRPDIILELRWRFHEGRVKGYPTLRSAYLTALVLIPGREAAAALREILDLTRSVEETYQIARGLAERGERGWAVTAVARALQPGTAAQRSTQEMLMELAARGDPVETSAQLVARAPRGRDATDPHVLGLALEVLPLDTAMLAGQTLLEDAAVTGKAKRRVLRNLCSRDEIDVFARLRRMLESGSLAADLRVDAAYAAANARGFHTDRIAYSLARAGKPGPRPHEIRDRFQRRLEEVTLVVETVVADLPPQDPRAQSMRRMLARHKLP